MGIAHRIIGFPKYLFLLSFCLLVLMACPPPVVIGPGGVPAAPSGLGALAPSTSQIALTWTDNASNETGFKIERSPNGGDGWIQIASTAADTTYFLDGGLSVGTIYYYHVHATNTSGDSSASNIVNATTQSGVTLPAAPTGLAAAAVSSSQINLSWADNSNNETGFKVERSPNGSSGWTQIGAPGTNTTGFTDAGLTPATTYYYRVCATNGAGDSAYTNTANAATPSGVTLPAAPSNLTATAASSSQINLSWTDNANNETGFRVERSPNGSTGWTQIASPAVNAASYADTGLPASTTYYYRVCATNSAGDSANSNTANAATQSGVTLPAAPSGLTATAASQTQINLAWIDNSNNETGFKLERSPNGSSGWTQIATPAANATSYSDTGLSASTAYYYRIRATNGAGDSTYSNTATTTCLPNPPSAPSGLTATAASSTQINLSWTDNAANETGFKVERSPNGSTSWAQIATTGTNVTTYSNTGLTASTAYYYRVRAANTGGDSGYSNTANATTQSGIVPPAAPGGLTATAASASQINLSWTDNANNETGFKVERSPNGSSSWAQIGTTGANVTTYSNTGLAAGTKYYYRVRATNSAGDSAYSNTANATTQLLSITLYPQYDNLIMIQSNDSSVQNTVYQNGELAVGVNWIYSSLTGIQDFLAGANLVKFDTSALAGRTIDSATLILETQYCGVGYYPRQWSLKAMYSSWSTSTITWSIFENTSYYTGSQINQSPPTYSGQMYNINLLTYVQNWANGTWSNYGICMTSNDYSFPYATSYDAFAFYSNEDTGGGRPRLVVTYH